MQPLILLLLWPVMVVVAGTDVGEMVGKEDGAGMLVITLSQMMEKQLADCHLVLTAADTNSAILSSFVRSATARGSGAATVTNWDALPTNPSPTATSTYQKMKHVGGLWREPRATCRLLILDFTSGDVNLATRVGESAGLWTQPETRVVIVGGGEGVTTLLLHPAYRNTRHALYVTTDTNSTHRNSHHVAVAWRRCGYCQNGAPGMELLGNWDEKTAEIPGHPSLFRDKPENYNGHQFRLVENDYFPYTAGDRVRDEPGTLVDHNDSLGTRIIQAISSSLNFTYEVREPVDRQWGNEVSKGVWNGVVGTLMREDCDLCLDLTVTPHRADVIQFAGAYIDESVVIVSSRPRPPPEYLSLIRPFQLKCAL